MIVKDCVSPMLSRIKARSESGTTSRMTPSTWPKMFSVSSTRVPAGARTCSRNCPASTFGKKSRPIQGYNASDPRAKPSITVERDEAVVEGPPEHALIAAGTARSRG